MPPDLVNRLVHWGIASVLDLTAHPADATTAGARIFSKIARRRSLPSRSSHLLVVMVQEIEKIERTERISIDVEVVLALGTER